MRKRRKGVRGTERFHSRSLGGRLSRFLPPLLAFALMLLAAPAGLWAQTPTPVSPGSWPDHPPALEQFWRDAAANKTKSECSGSHSFNFPPLASGKPVTYLRVYVWWRVRNEASENFELFRNQGQGYRKVTQSSDPGYTILQALNRPVGDRATTSPWTPLVVDVDYGGKVESVQTGWYYQDIILPVGIQLSQYKIVNTKNVFHVGQASGSNPSTYDWSASPILNNRIELEIKDLSATGGYRTIGTEEEICREGTLTMRAKIPGPASQENEYFRYRWEPGNAKLLNDRPNHSSDSSVVTMEQFLETQDVRVVAKGYCDRDDISTTVKIKVVNLPKPDVTMENQFCGTKAGTKEQMVRVTNFKTATDVPKTIEWEVHREGQLAGEFSKVPGGIITADASGNLPDPYYEKPVNLDYARANGVRPDGRPIHHIVRVKSVRGGCVQVVDVPVTVYAYVETPQLELSVGGDKVLTGDGTEASPYEVCSPVPISVKNKIPSDFTYITRKWEISSPGVVDKTQTPPAIIPDDHDSKIGTESFTGLEFTKGLQWVGSKNRRYNISLELADAEEQCRASQVVHIDLKPGAKPEITVARNPESDCAGTELQLKGSSKATLSATDAWKWQLLVNGEERDWGDITKVLAPRRSDGEPPTPVLATPGSEYAKQTLAVNIPVVAADTQAKIVAYSQSEAGCWNHSITDYTFYPTPAFKLTENITSDRNCSPVNVTVTADQSSIKHNPVRYSWSTKTNGTGNAQPYEAGHYDYENPTSLSQNFDFQPDDENESTRTVYLTMETARCSHTEEVTIKVPGKLEPVIELLEGEAACPGTDGVRNAQVKDMSVASNATYQWSFQPAGSPAPSPVVYAATQVTSPSVGKYVIPVENSSKTQALSGKLILEVSKQWPSFTGACKKKAEVDLTVYPHVNPQISSFYREGKPAVETPWPPANPVCSSVDAIFRGDGAPTLQWKTDFLGKSTSDEGTDYQTIIRNPSSQDETFTIRLIGLNSFGCVATQKKTFVIRPQLDAQVETKVIDPCVPYIVEFTAKNATQTSYESAWGYSAAGTPEVTGSNDKLRISYTTPGDYQVEYTAKLKSPGLECSSTWQSEKFTVRPKVKADFSIAGGKDWICAPETLEFLNTSPNAPAVKWYWGNENPDGEVQIDLTAPMSHTFHNTRTTPENIRVRMVASNLDGTCADKEDSKKELILTVYPELLPTPFWELKGAQGKGLCYPVTVELNGSSPTIDSYTWTLKPQSIGTQISESSGTPPKKTVSMVPENPSDNDVANYEVYFSGRKDWMPGRTCILSEYRVENEGTTVISIPPNLNLQVSALQDEICSGTPIDFDNRTTGGNVTCTYDFRYLHKSYSEPRTQGGPKAVIFENHGLVDSVYNVLVTATQNTSNCVKDVTIPITVHPQVTADFGMRVKPEDACSSPYLVTFSTEDLHRNESTTAGIITTYSWDYDYDIAGHHQEEERTGVAGKGEHTHGFQNLASDATQTYDVTLHLTQRYPSNLVCDAKETLPVEVPPTLRSEFSIDQPSGCMPHPVTITLQGSGSPSSAIPLNYIIDWGDGTSDEASGNNKPVNHTYDIKENTVTKDYDITVRAKRDFAGSECIVAATKQVKLFPIVTPKFEWPSDLVGFKQYPGGKLSICTDKATSSRTVALENKSRNGAEFTWEVLSGTASFASNLTTSLVPVEVTFSNSSTISPETARIRLTAKGADGPNGCEQVMEADVEVYPPVVASYTFAKDESCTPFKLDVTNTSTGALPANLDYEWQIDNIPVATGRTIPATSAAAELVNASTTTSQTHQITLLTKNELGCSDQMTHNFTVLPAVNSSISLNRESGCAPFVVTAEASSVSPVYEYSWSMPNATPTTATGSTTGQMTFDNTTQGPPSTQISTIQLTTQLNSTFSETCAKTTSANVTVFPKVYASFMTNKDEGCSPYNPIFTNTTDVEDPISAKWNWNFSDGKISQDKVPSLSFSNVDPNNPSNIQVTLTVESHDGCRGTFAKQLTVHPQPKAILSSQDPSAGCSPYTVSFDNTSEGMNLTYEYDFDDGVTMPVANQQSVSHTFQNAQATPYVYYVTLTATNDKGCQGTSEVQVTVNPILVADFRFVPGDKSCSPAEIDFDNQTAGENEYEWDFGDGKDAIVKNPKHTFINTTAVDQTYTVLLKATSKYGCVATVGKDMTLYATPNAKFSASPLSQEFPGVPVSLRNETLPLSNLWEYTWDFGDKTTSSDGSATVNHEYKKWGPVNVTNEEDKFKYTITLDVNNPAHPECKTQAVSYIYLKAPLPKPRFTPNMLDHCVPVSVFFTNQTLYYQEDLTRGEFYWDFGDDSPVSTEIAPTHVYKKPGNYNVKLVTKGDGGENSTTQVISVYPRPKAAFNISKVEVMRPRSSVKAICTTKEAVKYEWDFGDGSEKYDTEAPVHTYLLPGTYPVSLRVWNVNGCDDLVLKSPGVTVLPEGEIRFPTAFVPNPNGPNGGRYNMFDRETMNQVFHPYWERVSRYKLQIFNQWGEQIFESDDINIGWDGYRQGTICETGVYTWRCTGAYLDGEPFTLQGNVTLLR